MGDELKQQSREVCAEIEQYIDGIEQRLTRRIEALERQNENHLILHGKIGTSAPTTTAPRKPRTWWAYTHSDDAHSWGYLFDTQKERDHAAKECPWRLELVTVREVLPGDRELTDDVADLVHENERLEAEMERLKNLNQSLVDDEAAERARGDEYRRDWEVEKSRRQDAEPDRERADDTITRLRVADAEMSEQIRRLRTGLADRDRAIASLDADNQRLTDELAEAVGQMAAKDTGIAQLRADLANAKRTIEHKYLTNELVPVEQLRALQIDLSTLTAERDAAKRQLAIAVGCLDAMKLEKYFEWCIDHDVEARSHNYYCSDAARRCLELIADAAREE